MRQHACWHTDRSHNRWHLSVANFTAKSANSRALLISKSISGQPGGTATALTPFEVVPIATRATAACNVMAKQSPSYDLVAISC